MKTVGFIGGYDKTDLLLYISRILTLAGKKVILIDTATMQKTKYVVPTISPTASYITEFEGFDVAVGFKDPKMIKGYLGVDENKELDYDIALLDVDDPEVAQNFGIEQNYKNCFVTGFDLYSLKKGIQVLGAFQKPVKITKVLFSKNLMKEENEYLDYLSLGYKISWEKEIVNFPVELGNYGVSVENQIVSRIIMKRLSENYKDSLAYLITILFDKDITSAEIKKIMKNIERE